MPQIVSGLSEKIKVELTKEFSTSCEGDIRFYQELAVQLELNPNISLPLFPSECSKKTTLTGAQILTGTVVDEPDYGIDENLDPSFDPKNERRWMGGDQGSTSKGFRHMYFGGWKWNHPLTTFQVPFHAVGQAPLRFEIIAKKARDLLKTGEKKWGFRLLGWSLHYIQDLAQPFHAVQIVHLKMVSWSALFSWPLGQAFENLIRQTTRTIANYHWAYEDYVALRLREQESSPFYPCLAQAEETTQIAFIPSLHALPQLASKVIDHSIALAFKVGIAEMQLIGTELKKPHFNLSRKQGSVNYHDLATLPQFAKARERLHLPTCKALAGAVLGSKRLIQWALQP